MTCAKLQKAAGRGGGIRPPHPRTGSQRISTDTTHGPDRACCSLRAPWHQRRKAQCSCGAGRDRGGGYDSVAIARRSAEPLEARLASAGGGALQRRAAGGGMLSRTFTVVHSAPTRRGPHQLRRSPTSQSEYQAQTLASAETLMYRHREQASHAATHASVADCCRSARCVHWSSHPPSSSTRRPARCILRFDSARCRANRDAIARGCLGSVRMPSLRLSHAPSGAGVSVTSAQKPRCCVAFGMSTPRAASRQR
mmetsp:Transcript_268/g.926  ORF Transcript_268/g.926 Transcript_268/m.926 type:complete len:253 (-) Transcript_268:19-777(-)